jgi:hypothetical protein
MVGVAVVVLVLLRVSVLMVVIVVMAMTVLCWFLQRWKLFSFNRYHFYGLDTFIQVDRRNLLFAFTFPGLIPAYFIV